MLLVVIILVEVSQLVACEVLELGDLHLLHGSRLLGHVLQIDLLPWVELKLHCKWVLLLGVHSVESHLVRVVSHIVKVRFRGVKSPIGFVVVGLSLLGSHKV